MLSDSGFLESGRMLTLLEVKAYAAVASAFRAQGALTSYKKCLLQQLMFALGVNHERHKAEIRRVANDDDLAQIAEQLNPGIDSALSWHVEGRWTFPPPRRCDDFIVNADVSKAADVVPSAKLPLSMLPEHEMSTIKPPTGLRKQVDAAIAHSNIPLESVNSATPKATLQTTKVVPLKRKLKLLIPSSMPSAKTSSLKTKVDERNWVQKSQAPLVSPRPRGRPPKRARDAPAPVASSSKGAKSMQKEIKVKQANSPEKAKDATTIPKLKSSPRSQIEAMIESSAPEIKRRREAFQHLLEVTRARKQQTDAPLSGEIKDAGSISGGCESGFPVFARQASSLTAGGSKLQVVSGIPFGSTATSSHLRVNVGGKQLVILPRGDVAPTDASLPAIRESAPVVPVPAAPQTPDGTTSERYIPRTKDGSPIFIPLEARLLAATKARNAADSLQQ